MELILLQNFNDVCLAHLFTYRDFRGKLRRYAIFLDGNYCCFFPGYMQVLLG